MINYYTIQPPAILAEQVLFYWVLESDQPYIHRAMANGCAEILFHYEGRFDEINRDNTRLSSFISGLQGPSRTYRCFSTDKSFGIFGAYLYPFAIPQLFSLPANELSDQSPDLYNLLGNEGSALEECIISAKDNTYRAALLSDFLIKRLGKTQAGDSAVLHCINSIIRYNGNISVDKLAGDCFLSTRQFERKFKAFSGFNPKLYTRITRFQAAIQQYQQPWQSLATIAYDCGYYDQSHFIHEFREFSGHHPRPFFAGNAEGTGWMG